MDNGPWHPWLWDEVSLSGGQILPSSTPHLDHNATTFCINEHLKSPPDFTNSLKKLTPTQTGWTMSSRSLIRTPQGLLTSSSLKEPSLMLTMLMSGIGLIRLNPISEERMLKTPSSAYSPSLGNGNPWSLINGRGHSVNSSASPLPQDMIYLPLIQW